MENGKKTEYTLIEYMVLKNSVSKYQGEILNSLP